MSNNQQTVPSHFIVFVPGYMGSQLKERDSDKIVWLDFTSCF